MEKNHLQSSKKGALSWFWQRISAILLFVILIFHFVIYHFISQGKAISYQQVMAKVEKYGIWFALLQFIFLFTALFHGLNGLFNICEDYLHKKWLRFLVYSLIVLLGLTLLFIGTLTIVKIFVR